jgi:translocator protein
LRKASIDRLSRPMMPVQKSVAGMFAAGTLGLGMAIAALGYALGRVPEAGFRKPPIYPTDWMFWGVWMVLYPTMGVASYFLWQARSLPRMRLAWRWYLFGLAVNLTWVPVVHWFQSPVVAPAVMDAVAGVAMLPALWAITRESRPAFLWMIPMLLWGPFTGTLKIWQLILNRGAIGEEVWAAVSWSMLAGGVAAILQLVFLVRGWFLSEAT